VSFPDCLNQNTGLGSPDHLIEESTLALEMELVWFWPTTRSASWEPLVSAATHRNEYTRCVAIASLVVTFVVVYPQACGFSLPP
jgi:hypothetical protein